jgi:hypothetical protein
MWDDCRGRLPKKERNHPEKLRQINLDNKAERFDIRTYQQNGIAGTKMCQTKLEGGIAAATGQAVGEWYTVVGWQAFVERKPSSLAPLSPFTGPLIYQTHLILLHVLTQVNRKSSQPIYSTYSSLSAPASLSFSRYRPQ